MDNQILVTSLKFTTAILKRNRNKNPYELIFAIVHGTTFI